MQNNLSISINSDEKISDFNITKEQFFNFIRNKRDTDEHLSRSTQHYLTYFDRYHRIGKKGNWNWLGFFPLWFFYRRMYLNFFAIHFILNILGRGMERMIELPLTLSESIITISVFMSLLLGFWFLCMRYADYFYLQYVSQKISKGVLRKPASIIPILIYGMLLVIPITIWNALK